MKKFYGLVCGITILGSLFFLAGCTPTAEQVMPPLQYRQPINLHIAKKAYLNWQIGKQMAAEMPMLDSGNGGIVGGLIKIAIERQARAQRPSMYEYSYGKAQQAVFMTSLKNILQENNVFKQVELTTEPGKVRAEDVLINVYFKSTRVLDAFHHYKIILDVEMTIKTKGKPAFKRTYLVESRAGSILSAVSFKEQQTDVSQKLLQKMLVSLQQWDSVR